MTLCFHYFWMMFSPGNFPLPKRLIHRTALMNSRCAGHPKHTLAPWYSSRGTCSSMARELQPSGTASGQVHLSPLGTQAPNPELSTHLSLSHWEQWEYLQRSRNCLFGKQRWWRQRSDPTSHLKVPAPHPTAWPLPLASLAVLWATCSSQDFLVAQCFGMTGAFFASHQSSNQSCLVCLVGTGWIFYLQRPGSTDSHRSFSAACLCLSPFCLKEEKQYPGEKSAVCTGAAVRWLLHCDRQLWMYKKLTCCSSDRKYLSKALFQA